MAKYEYIHDYQPGQTWRPKYPNTASWEEEEGYTLKLKVSDPTDYARLIYYVKDWFDRLPEAVQVG